MNLNKKKLIQQTVGGMLRLACLSAVVMTSAVDAQAIVNESLSPRACVASRSANADSIVAAYITIDPAVIDLSRLDDLGVSIGINVGSTLTARLPLSAIAELSGVPGVKYVQTATPAKPMLDVARGATGIDRVNTGADLPKAYTGKGVIVGIIDSGFDYTHPAFTDGAGRLRISRIWEQTSQPTGTLQGPAKFGYGVELSSADEILAAGGDIRNNSHGTHVASLAAGADHYFEGTLQGMAPDAEIVLVSMRDQGLSNVCISDAIAYIFDYADSQDKPCVVNLSLGAHNGPHDGTSTFDVIADALQGPGRLIVGAAGNHNKGGFHIQHSFESEADAPIMALLEHHLTLSEKNVGGEVEIWMSPDADMEVALVAYRTSGQEVAQREVIYPAAYSTPTDISLGRNIVGTISVATETSPLNGKGHILLTSAVTGIRTGYAIGIEVTPKSKGDIDLWADDYMLGFTTKDLPGILDPTYAPTISEIGGTAKRILTVGAYTTRNEYTLLGETRPLTLDETVGDICSFSNWGPTVDGRTKPQVCAPGCFISGAVSTFDASSTLQYSASCEHDGTLYLYGYMQGTSMATPIVTGIVASWLEAWPEMTPEDLEGVVAASSIKDDFTGPLTQPDNHWGYGKIDAYAGISECLKKAQPNGLPTIEGSDTSKARIVYDGSGIAKVIFTTELPEATVNVYTAQGALAVSRSLGNVAAGDIVDIDLNPLPQGFYLISTAGSTLKIAK